MTVFNRARVLLDEAEPRPTIVPADGGGGRWARELAHRLFGSGSPAVEESALREAALIETAARRWVLSSDTFVVRPLVFPGGDIGSLAVHATINDLAMSGARPRYLTVGMILEEGLSIDLFHRVADSVRTAAAESGAEVVLGDVKVVQRGKGDGIFIHVTGIGLPEIDPAPAAERVRPGDLVLINGDVGRHAMAIMAAREAFSFGGPIVSDCRPLFGSVERMLAAKVEPHGLRTLTRGGLVGALNDVADAAGVEIVLEEARIPVDPIVADAGRFLGLDPLYLASEGRYLAFIAPDQVRPALRAMREADPGAVVLGRVHEATTPRVLLESERRAPRVLEVLSGSMLPRLG